MQHSTSDTGRGGKASAADRVQNTSLTIKKTNQHSPSKKPKIKKTNKNPSVKVIILKKEKKRKKKKKSINPTPPSQNHQIKHNYWRKISSAPSFSLYPGSFGATISFHSALFKKKKDALYFSIYLITSGGWDTWFSWRLWFVGLTTLLCSELIIDIILLSVAMTTLWETFNFLSSIIIIYEAICCGKWIQPHLHDW